jgi:hypothetical protein
MTHFFIFHYVIMLSYMHYCILGHLGRWSLEALAGWHRRSMTAPPHPCLFLPPIRRMLRDGTRQQGVCGFIRMEARMLCSRTSVSGALILTVRSFLLLPPLLRLVLLLLLFLLISKNTPKLRNIPRFQKTSQKH